MPKDFVGDLSKQLLLSDTEAAILRASGVRTIEDVDSLVSNFPSLGLVGLQVPLLSATSARSSSRSYAMLSSNIAKSPHQYKAAHGALPPPQAKWKLGAAAPMPAAAARTAAAAAPVPAAPPPAVPPLAAAIDLRLANWPIRYQGSRGTCVSFASAACIESLQMAPGANAPQDLAEQFLYWAIKTNYDPQQNTDGTWLSYARAALAGNGICTEVLCPYNPNPIPNNVSQSNPGIMPTAAAVNAAAANKISPGTWQSFSAPGGAYNAVMAGLNTGRVVAVTVPVFTDRTVPGGQDNWSTPVAWQYGRVLNPPPTAVVSDGHAVCVTGFVPDPSEPLGGYFIIRNSWSTQWASAAPSPGNTYSPEAGYGEISATYIENYLWEILYY